MLKDILAAIKALPKTQKDLRTLAQASKQAQSPQVQQAIKQAQVNAEQYAYVNLGLQTATLALLGVIAVILITRK